MGEQKFLTVQEDYHKVQVPVDDILYLTIEGRKTKITRTGGSVIRTNRSLKDVYADLPEGMFSSINRGIVVSRKYTKSEKNGVLTMADGTTFRRRVRSDRLPPRERVRSAPQTEVKKALSPEELSPWMEQMPLPLCVMELVYLSRGGGVEFVLRYCNHAMEELEHVTLDSTAGKPITNLPGAGNPKWLSIFADVAINGSSRVAEDVWEDTGAFYRIVCYQPQPGFCALVLIDLTKENSLVQELFRRETK